MSGPFVNLELTQSLEVDGVAFEYRLLSGEEAATMGDLALRDGNAAASKFAVRAGLKGWKGNGAPPFPDDIDQAVAMLNFEVYSKLSQAIVEQTTLTESQRGN